MSQERFAAEITFSGLCLVCAKSAEDWDTGRTRGPKLVQGVEILLVDTTPAGTGLSGREMSHGHHEGSSHRHYPRLTYYAEDHLGLRRREGLWDGKYSTSPEGKETVCIGLEQKNVEIIAPWPYHKRYSHLKWCEKGPRGKFLDSPVRVDQDDSLDWVLRDEEIGLVADEVDRDLAVTKVVVPNGIWTTRGTHRNREVDELAPVQWRVGGGHARAVARDLILRLEGLRYGPTIRISDRHPSGSLPQDIVLTPGVDRCLKLSISNLPDTIGTRDVSHVSMYKRLTGDRSKPILEPRQVDDVVCQQAACDIVISVGRRRS